jgi:hypothetical protein
MLTDGLQSQLRRSKNLTPIEKQDIYEDARRPVNVLFSEVKELSAMIHNMRDTESTEFKNAVERIKEIQSVLIPVVLNNAKQYVWDQLNNAGKMGVKNETGEVEVDFHALHTSEGMELFDDHVLPILEAVGKVLLIVGRGNNSEGKVAKLKPTLQKHIERHTKCRFMQHSDVEGNEGVISVEWIKFGR